MTEPTDAELVGRVVDHGDEAAFRTLYHRHTPVLFRLATRMEGGLDVTAEELVHDVWIRANDRWASFRWQSSLRTWLVGFLVNRVREARRSRSRQMTELTEDVVGRELAIDDRLDLEQAVASLPFGYRTAVVMHDIEGYTHEDIATCLGIDVGTSKSQLSRARRALRRWLEPNWSPT